MENTLTLNSWAFEASEVMRQTVLYNISKVSSVSDTWDLFEQISLPVLFPYTDPSTGEVLSLVCHDVLHLGSSSFLSQFLWT